MSFIFIEVMFFEISKNKNPSKITRYTVVIQSRYVASYHPVRKMLYHNQLKY